MATDKGVELGTYFVVPLLTKLQACVAKHDLTLYTAIGMRRSFDLANAHGGQQDGPACIAEDKQIDTHVGVENDTLRYLCQLYFCSEEKCYSPVAGKDYQPDEGLGKARDTQP